MGIFKRFAYLTLQLCIAAALTAADKTPRLYCNFDRHSVATFIKKIGSMCALLVDKKVKKILVEDGKVTKAFDVKEKGPHKYSCEGKEFTTPAKKLGKDKINLNFGKRGINMWAMNRGQKRTEQEYFKSLSGDHLNVPDYIRVEDGAIYLTDVAKRDKKSGAYKSSIFSGLVAFDHKNEGAVVFDEKEGNYAILKPVDKVGKTKPIKASRTRSEELKQKLKPKADKSKKEKDEEDNEDEDDDDNDVPEKTPQSRTEQPPIGEADETSEPVTEPCTTTETIYYDEAEAFT
ncbi:hypothetical protein FOL47_007958 [Perkinsus chesapeaki]|uniref:Uncharacterized protein n=1 Tax=Perkinsus chesapeaki TaxID=330153 RepID=A0A7J6LGX8_PERCH|nr:hypothetical protein FOL47_007958 [Perkinsus chesapeaki]